MLRSRVLSDNAVIARLNADYVPVTINITDAGWPDDAPALAPWMWGYDAWPFSKLGFVNALVCDPTGRLPYAWAGSGMKSEFEQSANYHPDLFMKFLDRADVNRDLVDGIHRSDLPVKERHRLVIAMLASEFDTTEDKVEWFIRKRMREDVLD